MRQRRPIQSPNRAFMEAIAHAEQCYSQQTPTADEKKVLLALQDELDKYIALLRGDDYAESETVQKALSRARNAIIRLTERTGGEFDLLASPVSQFIKRLSDEDANQLAKTLMEHPSFPKLPQFQEISQLYECRVLAGENSTNILLIPKKSDREAEVLRFERRDNIPLIETLKAAELCPMNVVYPNNSRLVLNSSSRDIGNKARYMEVVPFFPQNNAFEYVRAPLKSNPDEKLFRLRVFNVAQQMCSNFLNFEKNNIFFSDAKPQNWLVDSKGQLKIQGPSLLTDLNPLQIYFGKKNCFPASPGFCHNEIYLCDPQATPAQSHSCLFGRCLFTMLTGHVLPDKIGDENLDKPIDEALLSNAQMLGPYSSLIHDLVRPNPEERIPLSEAQNRLIAIGAQHGFLSTVAEKSELTSSKAPPFLSKNSSSSSSEPSNSHTTLINPSSTSMEEDHDTLELSLSEKRNQILDVIDQINDSKITPLLLMELDSLLHDPRINTNPHFLEQRSGNVHRFLIALSRVNNQRFGDDDHAMTEFLRNQIIQFYAHLNHGDESNQTQELLVLAQSLARENGPNQAIHQGIRRLERKSDGAEKIDHILQAARTIPVEARATLNTQSKLQELKDAMNEKRGNSCFPGKNFAKTYRDFLKSLQDDPHIQKKEDQPPRKPRSKP